MTGQKSKNEIQITLSRCSGVFSLDEIAAKTLPTELKPPNLYYGGQILICDYAV
jgi:hypothetical protein